MCGAKTVWSLLSRYGSSDKQPEQSTPPTTRKEFLTNSARAGARPPARSPGSLGWVKSAASKPAISPIPP